MGGAKFSKMKKFFLIFFLITVIGCQQKECYNSQAERRYIISDSLSEWSSIKKSELKETGEHTLWELDGELPILTVEGEHITTSGTLTLSKSVADSLCKKYGHIQGDNTQSTSLFCPSYIIETDSTTEIIYPACNSLIYTCKRCSNLVTEMEKERKFIIKK